jgi:hypothetical protein
MVLVQTLVHMLKVVRSVDTYSKPTCEWKTSRAHRIESITGFSDPAAKGATVKGTRPAATSLLYVVSIPSTPTLFVHLSTACNARTSMETPTSQSSSDNFHVTATGPGREWGRWSCQ